MLETDQQSHGFGRPWLVRHTDQSEDLFFSARNRQTGAYGIGIAKKSVTGEWYRADNLSGFNLGEEEFGRDALMYASFISIGKTIFCFYNGDDFGRAGFAIAEAHLD